MAIPPATSNAPQTSAHSKSINRCHFARSIHSFVLIAANWFFYFMQLQCDTKKNKIKKIVVENDGKRGVVDKPRDEQGSRNAATMNAIYNAVGFLRKIRSNGTIRHSPLTRPSSSL